MLLTELVVFVESGIDGIKVNGDSEVESLLLPAEMIKIAPSR